MTLIKISINFVLIYKNMPHFIGSTTKLNLENNPLAEMVTDITRGWGAHV